MKEVGIPKFHSWGKCTMPLTNTSSMHNMFGASVSEVYNIIWCQFDLKIDNLMITFLLLLLGCVAT